MINIHLNGDIVRCPDIRAIHKRTAERKDIKKICRYNIYEDNCKAWQNSLQNWQAVKKNHNCGRCMLSGSLVCPGHVARAKQGRKEKNFTITNQVYRKMSSAAHDLVKSSKTKTLFITLTFPKFKTEYNEKTINTCFSKFVENLRRNYNCSGYVAVREYGENNHRVHFHLLCAIPYVKFNILNAAWCAAISDISESSPNAVRTTKKTLFIKNPVKALRYVCKYFSKARHTKSKTRIVFISNNLIKVPINVIGSVNDILKGYKGIYINRSSEFTTTFRITNPDEFARWCGNYLYEAFEKAYQYPLFTKRTGVFYRPAPD